MHFWVQIAGTSELALRAPSAIAIVVAAACTAEIGKRLFTFRAGLAAGLLLAVAPRITSLYSRDARMYGLLLGAACASSLAIVLVTERASRRRWLAYGASVVVLGLIHVLAIPLLISHAVLVHLRGGWSSTRRWLLVAALGATPAALVLLYSRIQGGYPNWGDEPNIPRVLRLPEELLGSPTLAWFLVGLAVAALARTTERVFLAVWLFLPVILLYLVSHLLNPSWIPRYVLLVVPALVLLAARSMTNSRVAAVVGAVFVVGLVWQPTLDLRRATSQWQDYRAATEFVEARAVEGDAIVYDHPAHRQGLEYYWGDGPMPDDVLFDVPADERARLYPGEHYPMADVSLDGVDRVWVIGAQDRPLEIIAWLDEEGLAPVETHEVPGLPVMLAERP
jgi:mannosyltransferase